jgi:4-amino-4-deoxy-L-arabinose transferase-like glycosyltransferase
MKRGAAILSAVGLFFLYFFGLTRTGLLGPDEPRYAAIGRAMAATGDWITPRLWGAPWFEKPALLYWMTAAAFKAGFGAELAPRLPVALASVAFLVYFFVVLRREFGDRAAWYSAVILATSAGWLAYSHVAITDLPMSAAFAAAMLGLGSVRPLAHARGSVGHATPVRCSSMLARGSETFVRASGVRASVAAGVMLGLAVLAKGLVPLALFIPALWFMRRRIRDLALVFGAATLIAAPWYVLVTWRNGRPFLDEFFWKHHFGRFLDSALQHQQPVWFYVPVLLAGVFPWTPLLALLFSKRLFQDRRAQFLLAWFAWGFLFFSVSRNKLPGYLLPLLPPVAALMGMAASETRARSVKLMAFLAASAMLLCLVPTIEDTLPQVLLVGMSHTSVRIATGWIIPGLLVGLACAYLEKIGRRDIAMAGVAALSVLAVGTIVWRVYPELDRELSGRTAASSITCLPPTNRSQRYSLDYYAGRDLPDCK